MSKTLSKKKWSLRGGICQIALLLVLASFVISPILSVEYFFQQDGLGHLYTSYVMKEIISGNIFFYDYFSLNSFAVPNSIGHWLMAILSSVFSVGVTSKIVIVLSLTSIPVSAMVLRWQVCGERDVWLFGVLGFVISLNTLWFVGAYNFIFATAIMTVAVGFYYNWRLNMTLFRAIVMALFLVTCFIGHIVSFGVLIGTIVLLIAFTDKQSRQRAIAFTALSFLAILPFLFAYIALGGSGEPMRPHWRNVANPYSIIDWCRQFITLDPFALISRRTIPFTNINSAFATLGAPILWILIAVGLWLFSSLIGRTSKGRQNGKFVLLFVASGAIFVSIFGPDDLGLLNGSILRERLLICGILLLTPIISFHSQLLKKIGLVIFLAVAAYQTIVLWEFAKQGSEDAKQFQNAGVAINIGDSIASIIIVKSSRRFHSFPVTQMVNSLGYGKNVIVLDNYEIGHRLFPLVSKSLEQQRFAFDLTTSNVFYLDREKVEIEHKLEKLNSVFSTHSQKFDKLVVWGDLDELDRNIYKYFDELPIYDDGQVRVLVRKKL